jgi:sulfoxide reductase heme-binding subunit YedZ
VQGRASARFMNTLLSHRAVKPLVFMLALLPFANLLVGALTHGLGPNPAEALTRGTGDWTLRLICLTLVVTPLRQITGWVVIARWRRMLGLYSFFYGLLHFLCYAWLDMGFDLAQVVRDIPKRPFVLVGTLALLLMLPLAATSSNRAVKAMGSTRWRQLHRLVYVIALLGLLHFFWMRSAKNDFGEVGIYAAVVALLLGWRAMHAWRTRALATGGRKHHAGFNP